MPRFLVIVVIGLLLAGCKAQITTVVKLSELDSAKEDAVKGDVFLEIAACNHYSDSRKPSQSLIKSQTTVPRIFPNAKYIECFSKNFKSYAHFEIPIRVIRAKLGEVSTKGIALVANDSTVLAIIVPSSVKRSLEQIKNESFGLNNFNLEVEVTIDNDTGNSRNVNVLSAYANETPYTIGAHKLGARQQVKLKLSDVSVDQALARGASVVLTNPGK